jgi:hypothetical protein
MAVVVSDELRHLREAIEPAIREHADMEGVLTGFVVIAEWSEPDGDRWITKTAGDLNDDGPPIWTVKGWLYHALDTAQRDADEATDDDPE